MNKINKTIYIITECPYVGIFTGIVEFSKILKSHGFDICYLFPLLERNRYGESQQENEIILQQYGTIIRVPLRRRMRCMVGDIISLRSFFRGKNNDIVISFTNYAGKICKVLYFLGIIKNLYHSPNCLQTKRFSGLSKYIDFIIERFLSQQVKYYLACGPSEAYLLLKDFGVSQKKILLLPNFRSNISFPIQPKKYDFIYVGRMVDDKGVNKILEVFSLLGMLQKIIFVGDGPQLPKYKTLYPNACFLGRVMPEKVLELLAQSKYYISASLMEGMPYGLIEAMSLGIVPVVSDVEGHKDLIIQGYNGFLFRDNADLLNSIFKINLISEDYYKNISQSAIVSMSQLRQSGEASLLNIFSKN